MSLEQMLARARADAGAGDLGRARDRLTGLLSTYPDRLSLRRELGEICWAMRDRAMAGRYWYLEEEKTEAMRAAVEAFERSCGSHPARMLRALRFRGDVAKLESAFARHALADLLDRAAATGERMTLKPGRGAVSRGQTPWKARAIGYGCMLVVAGFIVLAIIGLLTVVHSLF